jgi:hypothetical protein
VFLFWRPIQLIVGSLQRATEGLFRADASRPPYAKTPQTPASETADLEVPLKGDPAGGGLLSFLHILY